MKECLLQHEAKYNYFSDAEHQGRHDMKYNYIDFEYFIKKAPYMRLAKSRGGYFFISHEIKLIHAYSKFIPQYPQIKCEPLEFLYQCHQSLCALDEKLFEDFINSGWRGIIWASWLAAISPYPESYRSIRLLNARDNAPYNQWIVDLALASLSEKKNEANPIFEILDDYKNYISILPYKKLPLRECCSEEYIRYRKKERKVVLAIYKNKGIDAAIKHIKETPKSEYDVEYKDWLIQLQKA